MEGDISLNVFTNDSSKTKHSKKSHRDSARDLSDDGQVYERPVKRRKGARGGDESQERSPSKKRARHHVEQGVVSSLWGGNPDVPTIPKQKTIKSEGQPLFSQLTFENAGLHPYMVKNLGEVLGSSQMTEVQKRALPVLLAGKDALVRSQTGSGKTLTYSVPIIQALQEVRPKIDRSQGTLALIVVPTRELALQTYEWLLKLVKPYMWLVPGVLTGGEKRKSEKARMRKGMTVLVATPGRLLDHMTSTEVCALGKVRFLVLDEADRMMDMGYETAVANIVTSLSEQGSTPDKRQTVLLSATLGPGVERLAGLALREGRVFVDASQSEEGGEAGEELSVPDSLEQWVLAIPAKLRLVALAAFIAAKCELTQERKMLVFCATQDMVDYLTPLLASGLAPREEAEEKDEGESSSDEEEEGREEEKMRVQADVRFFRLHGSMTQKDRMEVFKTFRDSPSGVLLCTDVAARGLDMPCVDWIVQFTAPATPQDYVHRVGRTARVGVKGSAVLFLAPSELGYLDKLSEHGIRLQEMDAEGCLDDLLALLPKSTSKPRKGSRRKTWRPSVEGVATALQIRFETSVLQDKQLHELAVKAYTSWVRFYASYPYEAREVFHYKALHLGHYAKSFALRDAPSAIGGIGKRNWQRDNDPSAAVPRRRNETRNPRRTGPSRDKTRDLVLSEYASGM